MGKRGNKKEERKSLAGMIMRYPLSCLCIAAIWILCFIDVPETPLDDVSFIDKWAHVLMYGGTCIVIWTEYLFKHRRISPWRLFLFAFLAPILMSGMIEILQACCTEGRRSGDWLDFASNAIGVTLATCVCILPAWWRAKAGKENV